MDLKNFVAETITQIVAGVADATERVAALGTNAKINPVTRLNDDPATRKSEIVFDVAVTVSEQADDKKIDKVGASAGFLSVVSAKVAGESGNESIERQRNETVSRVRFAVPIAMPSEIKIRGEVPVSIPTLASPFNKRM